MADAYGWELTLSDEEIVARLLALNKLRAKEEGRGRVRWLRPEYQIPLFGSAAERAELDLEGVAQGQAVELETAVKPSFPADDIAQTAAVIAVLASAATPLDSAGIANAFTQGRGVEPKIRSVLAALARMGLIASSDGTAFILRRVA